MRAHRAQGTPAASPQPISPAAPLNQGTPLAGPHGTRPSASIQSPPPTSRSGLDTCSILGMACRSARIPADPFALVCFSSSVIVSTSLPLNVYTLWLLPSLVPLPTFPALQHAALTGPLLHLLSDQISFQILSCVFQVKTKGCVLLAFVDYFIPVLFLG